jgi:hypothetical protein
MCPTRCPLAFVPDQDAIVILQRAFVHPRDRVTNMALRIKGDFKDLGDERALRDRGR